MPPVDYDALYLCWQGVPSKQSYYVQRWDEKLTLNLGSDQPLAAEWPATLFCLVDCNPLHKNPVLPDYLMSVENWLMVSGRLRKCLEAAGVSDVEYLPVEIIDPTGLKLDNSYSIVHTLNSPDCLDLDASGAKRSRAVRTKAEKIQRIAMKNDPGKDLFRPASFNKISLLSWKLAGLIADQGFTGFRFMGLFDYGFPADLPANPKRAAVDALCNRLRTNTKRPS